MSTRAAVPLTSDGLPALAGLVPTPTYDRATLRPSIVHIGVGGFHRAHLATYVHDLCAAGHRQWAIVGAGVLADDKAMADALDSQDHLYSLITRGPEATTVEVIGSLIGYIHAEPDPDSLVDQIAQPTTQVVSLTITEGGYPVDDRTGEFLPDSPVSGPGSSFALIAAGLDQRRRADGDGLTILSCDNIMSNGRAAQTSVRGEAERIDPDLVPWIDANVTFPNSMVDRITPATTDDDRAWLASTHSIADRWPVVAEPFRQWVVEDEFGGERPPLEELDVIVTADVAPYEVMKLRLLNAGHSCIAYLAALEGIETVDAALADPALHRYIEEFLHRESKPVLPHVQGIDLDGYIASLLERFSNPGIRDQISRLCLDGSAKFPKFLLPTVRGQLEVDGPVELAALALAGWCEYLNGLTTDGAVIERSPDPLLDEAIEFASRSKADPTAFLGFSAVFADDLVESPRFVDAFVGALQRLRAGGVRSTIEAMLNHSDPTP